MYLKAAQRAISQFATVLVLCCSGIVPIQAAQAQDMPQLCVADSVQPELTALSAYVVGVSNSSEAIRMRQDIGLTPRVYPSYEALEQAALSMEVLVWQCQEPLTDELSDLFPGRISISYESVQENAENAENDSEYFTESPQLALRAAEVRLIESVGTVRIGLPANSAPTIMRDNDGNAIGIDAEIVQLIHQRTGIEFEWQDCGSWTECVAALEAQEVDALSFMTPTAQRQRFAAFSVPYWNVPWAIASMDTNPVRVDSFTDLSGKRLAIVESYSIAETLQQVPDLELVPVNSPAEGLNRVLDGRADAYIDSLPLLVQRAQEQQTGHMVLSVFSDEPGDQVTIGVRRELLGLTPVLDRAILSITEQQRTAISERWFSAVYVEETDRRVLITILFLFGLVAVMVTAWVVIRHMRLNRELNKRRETEARMKHMAMHDSLTNLPNRNKLEQVIDNNIKTHELAGDQFAVLFLDLDGFKVINDEQGHDLGDEILKKVAARLESAVRQSDLVARQGGDEFVVVLSHINDQKTATDVGYKLIARLDEPFTIGDYTAQLGVSVGVAIYPGHGTTREDLMRAADEAMYEVKNAGKHDVVVAPYPDPSSPPDPNSQSKAD